MQQNHICYLIMSNECENNIFADKVFLITVTAIVIGCIVFTVGSTLNDLRWSNSYFDTCYEFTSTIEEITTGECIKYIGKNPSATGQDIIDYYNVGQVKLPENTLVNTIDPSR